MEVYYFDSSALVKRYAQEVGSPWVISLIDPQPGNDIFTALVVGVEDANLNKAAQTEGLAMENPNDHP